jgi:hypothetical protein
MRQDRLTSSLTRLAIVLMILLFGAADAAKATPNRLLLQSEESFRDQLGDRAVQIAKGVYQVQLPSGEQIRVAFGQEGLKYDIAKLRAEISMLQSLIAQDSENRAAAGRLQLLTRALAGLEKHAAEQKDDPRSLTANAAVQGSVCSRYVYYLDGGHTPGLVGGTTWGEASIFYLDDAGAKGCDAYSYVGATDEYNNYYWAEDTAGGLREAEAAATVDCSVASWFCPKWESYNWIQTDACSNGFRSIYRWGGNS